MFPKDAKKIAGMALIALGAVAVLNTLANRVPATQPVANLVRNGV